MLSVSKDGPGLILADKNGRVLRKLP
jgi:hypothetical protein